MKSCVITLDFTLPWWRRLMRNSGLSVRVSMSALTSASVSAAAIAAALASAAAGVSRSSARPSAIVRNAAPSIQLARRAITPLASTYWRASSSSSGPSIGGLPLPGSMLASCSATLSM